MAETEIHEFRVKSFPVPPFAVAIYNVTDGKETGDALYFNTQEQMIQSVERLLEMVKLPLPSELDGWMAR